MDMYSKDIIYVLDVDILNLKKKAKKINDKFNELQDNGRDGCFELLGDLNNDDSWLHCEKCKSLLPVFKIVVLKLLLKRPLNIKCRNCKHINKV